jgi:hypothetical protein
MPCLCAFSLLNLTYVSLLPALKAAFSISKQAFTIIALPALKPAFSTFYAGPHAA